MMVGLLRPIITAVRALRRPEPEGEVHCWDMERLGVDDRLEIGQPPPPSTPEHVIEAMGWRRLW